MTGCGPKVRARAFFPRRRTPSLTETCDIASGAGARPCERSTLTRCLVSRADMSVLAPRSADSAQRAQQDACAACAPDAKPVVFIVDDDASVCESLELLAESAGWQAESFGCAQEFL